MTSTDLTTGVNSPEPEERSSRDKFRTERDEDANGALETDEFGRIRKRRERSNSRSPPPEDGRRGKRRRSRSREHSRTDTYIPDYSGREGGGRRRPRRDNADMAPGGLPMMGEPLMFPMHDGFDDRGDRGSKSLEDPMKLPHLASFGHFVEYMKVEHKRRGGKKLNFNDETEMERRYEIYRENYLNAKKREMFEREKDKDWFRERYHPVDSVPFKAEVRQRRHELLAKFRLELESGKYDDLSYDQNEGSGSKNEDEVKKDEEGDFEQNEGAQGGEDAPNAADTPNDDLKGVHALFIRSIPPTVKRSQLIEACQKVEGFKYLVVGDPRPDRGNNRLGWAVFEDNVDIEEARNSLDKTQVAENYYIYCSLHHLIEPKPRFAPIEASLPSRLRHDKEQSFRLAEFLDSESGFSAEQQGVQSVQKRLDEVILLKMNSSAENGGEDADLPTVKKSLDLYIAYLRKVHNYDYYGGIESSSPEDFTRRSAVYLRRPLVAKPNEERIRRDWGDRLDLRVRFRLNPADQDILAKIGGKLLDKELDKFIDKDETFIAKESEGKFRCKECSKLFKGIEYVTKHVRSKHSELLKDCHQEVEFFNNFMGEQMKIDWSKRYEQPIPDDMMRAGPGAMNGMGGPMGMGMPLGMMNMPMMPPMMPPSGPMMNPMMMMQMMQGMMGGPMMGPMMGMSDAGDRGPVGRGRGRGRGRGGMGSRLGPPVGRRGGRSSFSGPANGMPDPRGVRTYNDLDNPVPSGDMEISYD